jgi:phosphonate degradation associated HDIG domain protein
MRITNVEKLLELMEQRAGAWYGREPVTQLQHALQCAQHAYLSGESVHLISAALLHDVGHLFEEEDLDAPPEKDFEHEQRAAAGLAPLFGPAVTEAVRLHVNAKRYLCQARPGYWKGLSEASKASLVVQGGIYTKEQAQAFIGQPFAADAVKLRLWDDKAKNPRAITPPLEFFAPIVKRAQRIAEVAD